MIPGILGKGKKIGIDPFFLGKKLGFGIILGAEKWEKIPRIWEEKKKPGKGWEYSRRGGENPIFFWICGFPLGISGSKLELGLEFWDFKLELWDPNWNFGVQMKTGLGISGSR